MFNFSQERILSLLYSLPAILFCLSIHEFAHGYVAYKCGDTTARNYGRLTINPVKHIDPIGFIALLLAGFGWANPVPVNTRNFKKPKRDMALVALAGPLSNFICAFLFAFVYIFAYRLYLEQVFTAEFSEKAATLWIAILNILASFVYINIGLAIFNLIPIPPLDGSRLIDSLLPSKAYFVYHKYEQYMSLVLIALLLLNVLDPVLSWARQGLADIVFYIPEKLFLS